MTEIHIILFELFILVHQTIERGIGIVIVAVAVPLLQGEHCHRRLIPDVQHIVEDLFDKRVRRKAFAPPPTLGSLAVSVKRECVTRATALAIKSIKLVHHTTRIVQRAFIVALDVRKIYRVGNRGYHFHPIRCKKRCREREHQQYYHAQHPLRQTEREATALALSALDIHATDREKCVGFSVFFDDSFAVHEAESVALFTDSIGTAVASDCGCIVHLFVENHAHILGRKPDTAILHGNLDKVGSFGCREFHRSTGGSEFRSIVGEGVYHKERESLVGFHHRSRWEYLQCQPLHRKCLLTFCNNIKKLLQGKIADCKIKFPATQFYPSFEDCIILFYLVGKFGNVCETLVGCHPCIFGQRQHSKFVGEPVHIRADAICHRERGPLEHILSLVLGKIEGVCKVEFFEARTLVAHCHQSRSLLFCHTYIGQHKLDECTLLVAQFSRRFDAQILIFAIGRYSQ